MFTSMVIQSPSTGPLYERVAERVQDLVDQGTLRPGERLPSVRKLHKQWHVSVSTVLQAYQILEARGVIEARPQSGHYVRPAAPRAPLPRPEPAATGPIDLEDDDLMVRITMRAGQRGLTRMGCGLPHRSLLPLDELDRVVARVARQALDSHDYMVSPGSLKLRRALARRMVEAGCSLSPDELVITNGAQEALDLCLRTVTKPGDAVVVESPTYFGLLEILRVQGLRAIEIPCDPVVGVHVASVEATLQAEQVAAVVLTPNFNNPLGALVPDDGKARLVAACSRHQVPLIEDDAYGEVGFDVARPHSLKAWDADGTVLSIGTLSKTLSPGLRVGWVAPGRFLASVRRRKLVTGLGCATIPQLAAAEYLTSGGYERHLRRLRAAYKSQLRQISDFVHETWPQGTRISRPRGGQFLWVELPEAFCGLQLFEDAWDAGISVAPGTMFSPSSGYRRHVRLNGSLPWSDEVQHALKRLGELARQQH